jgi:lipocalin-like protein
MKPRFPQLPVQIFIGLAVVSACSSRERARINGGQAETTSMPQGAAVAMVGTRQLAEYSNWDSTGTLVQEFGPQPAGYIILDGTGHFSVHIMRTPPMRPFSKADTPTPSESRELFRTYYGGFGRYVVDSAQSMIVFHVEGGTRPDFVGTDVRLPYQLTGDSLILGDGKRWRRVWLRVR